VSWGALSGRGDGGTRTDEPPPIGCKRLCKIAHIARFPQRGFFFEKKIRPNFILTGPIAQQSEEEAVALIEAERRRQMIRNAIGSTNDR
jgi:hypothetical protein